MKIKGTLRKAFILFPILILCNYAVGQDSRSLSKKENPAPEPTGEARKVDQVKSKSVVRDAHGKRVSNIDFEDASIEGKAKAPEGFVIQSRTEARFKPIIELRKHYRPQIKASGAAALGVGSP